MASLSLFRAHTYRLQCVPFFPSNIFRINVFLIWLVLMVSNQAHTEHTNTTTHRPNIEQVWKSICIYDIPHEQHNAFLYISCLGSRGCTKERQRTYTAGQRTREPHHHTAQPTAPSGVWYAIHTHTPARMQTLVQPISGKFINVRSKTRSLYTHILGKLRSKTHFGIPKVVYIWLESVLAVSCMYHSQPARPERTNKMCVADTHKKTSIFKIQQQQWAENKIEKLGWLSLYLGSIVNACGFSLSGECVRVM